MSSGLQMKYFVLKPEGSDPYALASRHALRAYAKAISIENPQFAFELNMWANREGSEDSDALAGLSDKPAENTP